MVKVLNGSELNYKKHQHKHNYYIKGEVLNLISLLFLLKIKNVVIINYINSNKKGFDKKMTTNKESIKIYNKLMNMNDKERKEYLEKAGITKNMLCDNLLNNPNFKNIPLKSLVIKHIKGMSDEDIINFVLKYIDKLPSSLIEKLL